jgi:hypothetical protein
LALANVVKKCNKKELKFAKNEARVAGGNGRIAASVVAVKG